MSLIGIYTQTGNEPYLKQKLATILPENQIFFLKENSIQNLTNIKFSIILIGKKITKNHQEFNQLGKTLLSYTGFENYGLNIVAAFDSDPAKCNIKIKNKTVYPVERLSEIIKKYNIRMGIITVPERFAQNICDIMVEAGIKAIWNFAPTHLIVPDKVALKNEDLAASLAILSSQLKVILNKQEN